MRGSLPSRAPRFPLAEVMTLLSDALRSAKASGNDRVLQDVLSDLRTALSELERLRARAARVGVEGHRQYNPGWHVAVDLRHLLTVSEAVTRAALERRESRGAHMRVDYPDSEPAFATVNIVVRRRGDAMTVDQEPIPPLPDALRRIVEGKD